jgi:spectrin beta
LQTLIDSSEHLSKKYPTNSKNLKDQQREVIKCWTFLQERTLLKKQELQSSLDSHKFESLYRDLLNFAQTLTSRMSKLETARDTAQAQILLNDHDELRLEIDARKTKFDQLFSLAKLIDDDISEKTDRIGVERSKLEETWTKKKVYLDQLIDLMIFLRDVANLDSICARQETILSKVEAGEDVEECLHWTKKHSDLLKVIDNQEDKFTTISDQAGKLVQQKHFESGVVNDKINLLLKRRDKVKQLAGVKTKALSALLLDKQTDRDVVEALSWMDEKRKQLETSAGQATTLEEKIKKLKKHKAFQAELATNADKIEEIIQKSGNKLLSSKWKELLSLSDRVSHSLEEAQDILEFENQLEKTTHWMRDKELLVSAGELGEDYEHCLEITKKLDQQHDQQTNQRINSINALAKRLIEKTNDASVQEKISRLNERWAQLRENMKDYRVRLERALQLHAFEKACDDLEERISTKIPHVSSEELTNDDEHVELMIRKLDGVEKEMTVIECKIAEVTEDAGRIAQVTNGARENADVTDNAGKMMPSDSTRTTSKLSKLTSSWDKLKKLSLERKTNLTYALEYTRYVKKLRELEQFTESALSSMKHETPDTVQHAEELIAAHSEVKIKVDSKSPQFNELTSMGQEFIKQGHPYSGEIKRCLTFSKTLEDQLKTTWEDVDGELKSSLRELKFLNRVKEAESAIADIEAVLGNDDVGGGSLERVQELLRKHDALNIDIQNKVKPKVDALGKEGEFFLNNDWHGN